MPRHKPTRKIEILRGPQGYTTYIRICKIQVTQVSYQCAHLKVVKKSIELNIKNTMFRCDTTAKCDSSLYFCSIVRNVDQPSNIVHYLICVHRNRKKILPLLVLTLKKILTRKKNLTPLHHFFFSFFPGPSAPSFSFSHLSETGGISHHIPTSYLSLCLALPPKNFGPCGAKRKRKKGGRKKKRERKREHYCLMIFFCRRIWVELFSPVHLYRTSPSLVSINPLKQLSGCYLSFYFIIFRSGVRVHLQILLNKNLYLT